MQHAASQKCFPLILWLCISFLDLLFFIVKFLYFQVFPNFRIITLNWLFTTVPNFRFCCPTKSFRNAACWLENAERPKVYNSRPTPK